MLSKRAKLIKIIMNLDHINWQIVIPKQNQLALTLIKDLNEELLSCYPISRVRELHLDKIDNKNGIFILGEIEQKAIAAYIESDNSKSIKYFKAAGFIEQSSNTTEADFIYLNKSHSRTKAKR